MITVSFDFDDTLSKKSVQNYAKSLIDNGVNVLIVTARYSNAFLSDAAWFTDAYGKEAAENINEDLYLVAKELNIKKENIIFMDMVYKNIYLREHKILWHLDDCYTEIMQIKQDKLCKTIPIQVNSNNWIGKCNRIIEKYGYKQ